jgi:hypothetical protein
MITRRMRQSSRLKNKVSADGVFPLQESVLVDMARAFWRLKEWCSG